MSHSVEEDAVPKIAAKYGWSEEVTRAKIRKAQEILHLVHPIDAVEFLLAAIPTIPNPVICDGCNVRSPWEHRCHGTRSVVQGEQTNKQCQCPDCFVVNELGVN